MGNLFQRTAGSLTSTKVQTLEPIEVAGKYIFKVLDARQIGSRRNLDGSVKEVLPEYLDETPEIVLFLQDVISKKSHIHRVALGSFLKYKNISEKDLKELKPYNPKEDGRDGYLLLMDKSIGGYRRVPAVEGDDEFEGLSSIFSRLTSAMGLPEGTTSDEYQEFKGRYFKGKLVTNDYTSLDGEEKSRLKLSTTFYSVSEEELATIMEDTMVEESFQ